MALPLTPAQQAFFKTLVLLEEGAVAQRTNYSMALIVFAPLDVLPIPLVQFAVTRPTVMVFANDHPLLNWAHPCRYLLFDLITHELYQTIHAHFPPDRLLNQPSIFRLFHSPILFTPSLQHPVPSTPLIRSRAPGSRYALLFSGKSNGRHVNDIHFLYETLVREFKYDPGNISVLTYDNSLNYDIEEPAGTMWSAASIPLKVDEAGTKNQFIKIIDWLVTKVGPKDSLLIHTSNHGYKQGSEAYICYYDSYENAILVSEFAEQLKRIPKHRDLVVMMEQCYSGGFINSILESSLAENVSVATACSVDQESQGGDPFDPFAENWIAALAGHYSNGTPLKVGSYPHTTMKEAFDFASIAVSSSPDNPQEGYKGAGEHIVLGKTLYRWRKTLPQLEPIIRKQWPDYSEELDKILLDHFDKLVEVETQLQKEQQSVEQHVLNVLINAIPDLPLAKRPLTNCA